MVFIDENGDLVLWQDQEIDRLALNALPDARILMDERGRLLLLTDATTRYDHGVLGDTLEAGSITLVETTPTFQVAATIVIPEPQVVEGITPLWADVTGDGEREIVVTVSDDERGGQIVIFDESGNQVAAGSAVGQGRRWQHPLAVASFGPEGELEVAKVFTPHLNGPTVFLRLEGKTLRSVAEIKGYTSHKSGSRILDNSLAGDFDGDGQAELLLPSNLWSRMNVLKRSETGVGSVLPITAGGDITTNLAAVSFADGSIAIGVGRRDKVLSLWLPPP
jgi:hypothetical protein